MRGFFFAGRSARHRAASRIAVRRFVKPLARATPLGASVKRGNRAGDAFTVTIARSNSEAFCCAA